MPGQISEQEFDNLFTAQRTIIDVRSPVEFANGSVPGSINLPILDDEQRRLVGIEYKQRGQSAAVALGNELVSGDLRSQRLLAWRDIVNRHPDACIACFRGGLRSRTAQSWLRDAAIDCPLITGGYKALRNHLLHRIDAISRTSRFLVVAGKTGCAKTHFLAEFGNSIDLEGRARHRGSAFGTRVQEQPSQATFENQVASDLIRQQQKYDWLMLEDESRAIGSLSVPVPLHKRMKESALVQIEESLEFRSRTILQDYVLGNLKDFKTADPDNASQLFAAYLTGSLSKIARRLGGDRYKQVLELMEKALAASPGAEAEAAHLEWIQFLLSHYYDPMYDYQLEGKRDRLVFSGTWEETRQWCEDRLEGDIAIHD